MAIWIASSCSRYFGVPAVGGIPQITIARLCLIVLVAYAVVMVGVRKPRLGARVPLEIVLWLLACCGLATGYGYGSFRPDPPSQEFVYNALVLPALSVSLILRSRLTERDVARFAILLTFFSVYLGLTAVFERLGMRWALIPAAIGDPTQGIHFGRSRGPFLQAAFNGIVIVMLVPIAMLLLRLPERRWKALGGVAMVLLCVASYLTSTRAALVGLAGVLVLGGLIPSASRRSYRAVILGLAAIGVILIAMGAPLIPRMDEESPINDRFDLLVATGEMVLTHPVIGVGYGNFDRLQHSFYEGGKHFGAIAFNKEFWEGGSHNTLLTPFAEMGVIVGALNIGFLLSRIVAGLRTRVPTPSGALMFHPVLICGSLMFVAFMLNAVFVETRYTATPTLLLWSFAAVVERYRWTLKATSRTGAAEESRAGIIQSLSAEPTAVGAA